MAAYSWLAANNPYYKDVTWDAETAALWNDDPEIPTKEEDIDSHQRVTKALYEKWLEHGAAAEDSQEHGFAMATFAVKSVHTPEGKSPWHAMVDEFARLRNRNVLRRLESLSTVDIAFVLQQFMESVTAPWTYDELISAAPEEWPEFLQTIVYEICAVTMEQGDDSEIVQVTCLEESLPEGKFQERADALTALEEACREGVVPMTDDKTGTRPAKQGRQKYPRVDAPKVFDSHADVIAENTPGYIARAFPKLFPYGTGDYHEQGSGLKKWSFGDWGRYVLVWHDQRFMRHPRFRYWFLNTWLRMKTPGARNVFWKQHPEHQDLTIDALLAPA